MSHEEFLLCILGMGVVTYLPRWLPLAFLTDRDIPEIMKKWLSLIPACILSALVAQAVFIDPFTGSFQIFQRSFFAAIPTLAFAMKTRSLGGTVIAGMLVYWILGQF
jgi:branched-subunit amino acid transport protein